MLPTSAATFASCEAPRLRREIAGQIGTTEQVIKNYLRSTFDKLGVWSRLELALYVAGHGGATWLAELGRSTQAIAELAVAR